jgi:hypothetical protein
MDDRRNSVRQLAIAANFRRRTGRQSLITFDFKGSQDTLTPGPLPEGEGALLSRDCLDRTWILAVAVRLTDMPI